MQSRRDAGHVAHRALDLAAEPVKQSPLPDSRQNVARGQQQRGAHVGLGPPLGAARHRRHAPHGLAKRLRRRVGQRQKHGERAESVLQLQRPLSRQAQIHRHRNRHALAGLARQRSHCPRQPRQDHVV